MIHVNFREVGLKVGDLSSLEKLAYAISQAECKEEVLVYFEFQNAESIVFFCEACKAMQIIGNFKNLEDKKKELSDEVDKLEEQIKTLKEEKEKIAPILEKFKELITQSP